MLLDRNDCEEPRKSLLRVTYKFMPRHNDVYRDANVPTLGLRGQGFFGCFRCARFIVGGE